MQEIDHALKTKAELERSKNKIRQREKTLMVQNGAEDKEIMEEHENDWTRMQKEISTILDPVATYSISRFVTCLLLVECIQNVQRDDFWYLKF